MNNFFIYPGTQNLIAFVRLHYRKAQKFSLPPKHEEED